MVKIADKYICIDIGGTKVLGALFAGSKIISKVKKKTKVYMDSISVIDKVVSIIDEILSSNDIKISDIAAISSGYAGVIDEDKGKILQSPNIPIKNMDIKGFIESRFKVPFFIANDVNMGILGEWKYGAGKDYKHLVGVFVGTGIGGGLIIDNKLYSGSRYGAGEIGHIILNTEGPLCGCGQRGCFEAYAGKVAILKTIKSQIDRGRKTIFKELLDGNYNELKSKYIKKALEKDDELAKEIIDRTVYYLAAGIGSVLNIFNPEALILGGGVIEALDNYIMKDLIHRLQRFTMPTILDGTDIKKAMLGDDSIIYGARALIDIKFDKSKESNQ